MAETLSAAFHVGSTTARRMGKPWWCIATNGIAGVTRVARMEWLTWLRVHVVCDMTTLQRNAFARGEHIGALRCGRASSSPPGPRHDYFTTCLR